MYIFLFSTRSEALFKFYICCYNPRSRTDYIICCYNLMSATDYTNCYNPRSRTDYIFCCYNLMSTTDYINLYNPRSMTDSSFVTNHSKDQCLCFSLRLSWNTISAARIHQWTPPRRSNTTFDIPWIVFYQPTQCVCVCVYYLLIYLFIYYCFLHSNLSPLSLIISIFIRPFLLWRYHTWPRRNHSHCKKQTVT